MQPTSEQLAAAVAAAASEELTKALDRIKHCLGQMTDEQIWQRESESMNSIGDLILHLCGNLRQWIVAENPLDDDSKNGGCVFPRLALSITPAGSLIGICGSTVHT